MDNVMIVGTPLALGILVSYLAEMAKATKLLPWIQKGDTWTIRLFIAVSALVVQVIFNLVAGDPLNTNVLVEAFFNYVTASAAYIHLFKNVGE
jgi:hypothetical protein